MSKKKMHKLVYKSLGIQPYMSNSDFSHSEVKLLYALRSNCYPAKMNFRKMNRGNLKCIFKCDQNETQSHIFENCQPLRTKLNLNTNVKLEYIYGTVSQQKKAVSIFLKIDNINCKFHIRKHIYIFKAACPAVRIRKSQRFLYLT